MSRRKRVEVVERDSNEVELPDRDLRHLEAFDEVSVSRSVEGKVDVKVDRYVGVIGLPSGSILDIRPKAPCNLLFYLAYVGRIDDELVEGADTGITEGESFVEVVARLYLHELDQILKGGLHQEYLAQESSERYLKGQLDQQRQLQKRGVLATKFECRFDELSHEILINKLLLDGLYRLRSLVENDGLRSDVNRYFSRFQQWVEHERMQPSDFDEVSLTRLSDHYSDALQLAELIFNRIFIENIRGNDRQFDTLLINMESLFQRLVYEVIDEVVDSELYVVEDDNIGHLVESTSEASLLDMEPDFYIQRRTDEKIVYVGDAKWKTDSEPEREDLYQIAAYQAKYGSPGMLVYPDLNGDVEGDYSYETGEGRSAGRGPLRAVELETLGLTSYDSFSRSIERKLARKLPSRYTRID